MRILQVSPGFHGYWRSIEQALRTRGHDVVTHVYDDRPSLPARLGHKLGHELPERLGASRHDAYVRATTARTLAALREHRPDAVLVVKGDVLGAAFWAELDRIPHALWLYDEIRRTRHTTEELARLGPVATYSASDAAALAAAGADARHLPLAFDPGLATEPSRGRGDAVVFVGARYPSREALLTGLAQRGVAVTAYGRDWSRHWVDRLRSWELTRPEVPSGRDVSRAASYRLMADGVAALNVHGDQDGFTMRTFEACGVGAVQLIDRADVGELYEPGREVAVFDGLDELVGLCERASRDRVWAEGLREAARRRTLAEHTFDHRVAVLEEMLR
ncbi:MAG: glycosyltransferase [Nocardioidaceae bacterium]|nr:glycosyltransferase [Nocardioidaceae bacterium]